MWDNQEDTTKCYLDHRELLQQLIDFSLIKTTPLPDIVTKPYINTDKQP